MKLLCLSDLHLRSETVVAAAALCNVAQCSPLNTAKQNLSQIGVDVELCQFI